MRWKQVACTSWWPCVHADLWWALNIPTCGCPAASHQGQRSRPSSDGSLGDHHVAAGSIHLHVLIHHLPPALKTN